MIYASLPWEGRTGICETPMGLFTGNMHMSYKDGNVYYLFLFYCVPRLD